MMPPTARRYHCRLIDPHDQGPGPVRPPRWEIHLAAANHDEAAAEAELRAYARTGRRLACYSTVQLLREEQTS